MTPDVALDIQDVTKRFGATTALGSVRLQVRSGEFLTLLGPSGSGKTTLLRLIVGFEIPTSGTILLGGRDISHLTPADRSAGMVFQQYALFQHMTVAQNIAYGLRVRRWKRDAQRSRVTELLELVQLAGYEERYPRQLSGGQQQRVALARALAPGPAIVLLDEPFSNLDADLRERVRSEVRTILRMAGASTIFVTHDQEEAFDIADRIAVMEHGRIIATGTHDELTRSNPLYARLAALQFGADKDLAPDSVAAVK